MSPLMIGVMMFFGFMIFCTILAWNVFFWHVDITTRARRKRQRLIRKANVAMRANKE